MTKKKTVWFEVAEGESIEECLERITKAGYVVTGRKEEPIFIRENEEVKPIRQLIKFKGILQ